MEIDYVWDNGSKRKIRVICCKECNLKMNVRIDRKHSGYCRGCKVKGEKNPQYGKPSHNKGKGKYGKIGWTKGKRLERKKEIVFLMGNKCQMCLKENLPIACYVTHHTNPEEKLFSVQSMLTDNNYEKYKTLILEEINKCILICKNCHAIAHYGNEKLCP